MKKFSKTLMTLTVLLILGALLSSCISNAEKKLDVFREALKSYGVESDEKLTYTVTVDRGDAHKSTYGVVYYSERAYGYLRIKEENFGSDLTEFDRIAEYVFFENRLYTYINDAGAEDFSVKDAERSAFDAVSVDYLPTGLPFILNTKHFDSYDIRSGGKELEAVIKDSKADGFFGYDTGGRQKCSLKINIGDGGRLSAFLLRYTNAGGEACEIRLSLEKDNIDSVPEWVLNW
jgi:hypothetical protein